MRIFLFFFFVLLTHTAFAQPSVNDLLTKATAAAEEGKHDQAVELLSQAAEAAPKESVIYYLRGRSQFCRGEVQASVADFDRYVKLRPEAENRQWERGISLYYAGEFARGAKQFELYQTYHDADVENAAWRFLCVARSESPAKARESLLPIRLDSRIPMMAIYEMYAGKRTPEEVLKIAAEGEEAALSQQLFYAHLYVGLWYEAEGKAELARKHITLSAEKYRISHYMGDVARIHAALLK